MASRLMEFLYEPTWGPLQRRADGPRSPLPFLRSVSEMEPSFARSVSCLFRFCVCQSEIDGSRCCSRAKTTSKYVEQLEHSASASEYTSQASSNNAAAAAAAVRLCLRMCLTVCVRIRTGVFSPVLTVCFRWRQARRHSAVFPEL